MNINFNPIPLQFFQEYNQGEAVIILDTTTEEHVIKFVELF